jgi:hypothetical protein
MTQLRFSYIDFVRENLDNRDSPVKPSNLIRGAMNSGATGNINSVHKRIRMAFETLASGPEYKRIRTADVSGYQYVKVT